VRLVLLPGLDGSGLLFRHLVSSLPASLQPIVVAYPADQASYSELLPFVMSSLPEEGRFLLLGESFSGPLAILAAAERPVGLAGVILAASFARCPVPQWFALSRSLVRAPLVRWSPWSLVARVLLGRDLKSSALSTELHHAVSTVSPAVLASRIREVLSVDVTQQLSRISVALLYIRAKRDILVRRSALKLIQRGGANVRVVSIDAPHMVLQAAAREASDEIAQFAAQAVAV
jgi:pimeloyl-[acyl-carrier protein] methyl ester esterase